MAPLDNHIQKEIFEKISKNDINGLKGVLSQCDLKTEIHDEHGMTPLQHAAYKGNKEMVQLLLDQGADISAGKHEFGYTALHFAALSGNTDICQMLLENGAKVHATNSVGRTPSQMAAFVGNHACVAVINNFVPKSDIDYYIVPTGFETEPKLPSHLSQPLHKFVMQVNLNPVRIALTLQKLPLLCDQLDKVKHILELMSEREMKRGMEANEIMSFKFHYLSCVITEIIRCKKLQAAQQESKKKETVEDSEGKKGTDPIELFIKKMLKSNKGEILEYQESFIRECVREFPNRECTIFRQMVSMLARPDSPGGLNVVTSAINGQRGFTESDASICCTCGEEKTTKKCSKCKAVQYCDRECQRLHWFMHKKNCTRLSSNAGNEAANEREKQNAISAATEALVSEIASL